MIINKVLCLGIILCVLNAECDARQAVKATPAQEAYLQKAAALTPPLQQTLQSPIAVVIPVRNESTFLRWTMVENGTLADLYSKTFVKDMSFYLDFGSHRTGYFSFYIYGVGYSVDAPARLQLTFGEVPGDVAETFFPYNGWLSGGWLPVEIIHVDYLPQQVNMPRRYAFRYVRVDVLESSNEYLTMFSNFTALAITTAVEENVPPLPSNTPPMLQAIDQVAVTTLRDIMQTISEDGPRRDLRLWAGDFRLHALSNQLTFKNNDLIKRCLYLFAGTQRPSGFIPSCVFEKPYPHSDTTLDIDYVGAYVATIWDYVQATGEFDILEDLWPVILAQMEGYQNYTGSDGLFNNYNNVGFFVDWSPADKQTMLQGIFIYTFQVAAQMADKMGNSTLAASYQASAKLMTQAALDNLWDAKLQFFVSGPNREVSWGSQAWMILSGVLNSSDAASVLLRVMNDSMAIYPGSPYMYHFFVEALLSVGLKTQALSIVMNYWGGMVNDGADTFWEVYNNTDSLLSPYNDVHMNSFCHGWSTTPTYWIRSGVFDDVIMTN